MITPDDRSQRAKVIDLVMLTLVNVRERTETEWDRLLAAGGWTLTAIQDGLIEARPVETGT